MYSLDLVVASVTDGANWREANECIKRRIAWLRPLLYIAPAYFIRWRRSHAVRAIRDIGAKNSPPTRWTLKQMALRSLKIASLTFECSADVGDPNARCLGRPMALELSMTSRRFSLGLEVLPQMGPRHGPRRRV